MNKIISLLLLLTLFACKKENISEPSYISIESIYLDSTTTSNITDAWVYIDDNLQGVYELPADFPVLASGVHKLRVKAGIKDNGIASNRIAYPFYSSYIIDEQNFDSKLAIEITPLVNYLYNNDSVFIEDFDGPGLNLETDSITFSINDINPIDGNYGLITLTDSIFLSELRTFKLENLPQAGAPVYLELDYKCNIQFLVGVYVNFPGSVLQKDLLWVTPKEDWNKIYVNLTSTISEAVGAESFTVFIGMKRDFEFDTNTVYLDNLKIVY